MITILTVPKPFRGYIDIIQRNAIKSWLKLYPKCEIILFGNDEGVAEAAEEFGILHVSEIESEFGLPLLNSVFDLGRKIAKNHLLAFINTDIILTSDFIEALGLVEFPKFLMAGRRWDINIKEPIQFNESNWEEKLRQKVIKEGKLHGPAGMDYFIFPRNLQLNLPAFVAGRPGYDNGLLFQARTEGIPVIDATKRVMIVHQNHDYSHRSGGEKNVFKKPEGKKNIELAGGFSRMLTLRDADWILGPDGLKKPEFPRIIFSKLSLFYPWRLILGLKRKLQLRL